MKYYLAHPFDSRKAMRQWELETEVQYDIEIINPFYDIGRCDVEPIDDGTKARYEGLNSTELVNRDLSAIWSCGGVIAYVNGDLSYGTIMEIVYAKQFGREVHLICTNGQENHPWLLHHSDFIYTSLEDFACSL